MKPILDAHLKARLEQARTEATRESWDAYRADSFLAALTAGTTRPGPTPTTGTATSAATTTPTTRPRRRRRPRRWPRRLGARASTSASAPPATTTRTGPRRALRPPPTAPTTRRLRHRRVPRRRGACSAPATRSPKQTASIRRSTGTSSSSSTASPSNAATRHPVRPVRSPASAPIPVAWINPLLPSVHTEMLIHDSVDIRAYATTTRHRTRPVDLSVRVRDRDCTVPRCHHDISELDHITDFADTHDTSVINVHGMCNANHDDKTYRDATFTRNDTHWNWWPPGTNPETTPPMTAPIGAHLTTWNLDHLPDRPRPRPPTPTTATHPPSSSTDARHR